jgi:hypothetical protein
MMDLSPSAENYHNPLSNGDHAQLPYEALSRMNFDGSMPGGYDMPNVPPSVPDDDGDESGTEEANPFDGFILHRRSSMAADLVAKHAVVHRVVCGHHRAEGEDHQDHPSTADYLDEPRLFAKDYRGSALRGQQPLVNPQEYWDEHPEVCAVITKEYNCSHYHRRVKDYFQVIANDIDRQVFNRLKPWLFRLPDNGPPAVSTSESIMISPTLTNALITLAMRNQLGEWNSEQHLKAPYDYFYHFRHDLRELSKKQFTPYDRQELVVLLDYIDRTQGPKFDQVDKVFADGKVTREYFSKLFRPNDLIVTSQEGQMRAHVAEKAYMGDGRALERQSVSLECWTWDFDGSFRKKTSQLTVSWPPTMHHQVPITQLNAWPLRLDKSDLREKLQKRGEYVWKCRKRRLMSYTSPTPTIFELQVVSHRNCPAQR